MKKIVPTIQEIWAACRPSVTSNKKKYTRKNKHKKKGYDSTDSRRNV